MNYTKNVSNKNINKNNDSISLLYYLDILDMIKNNNNEIPESFYIDSIILMNYCWHCQNCNMKHIYLNCSFTQSSELPLYYECSRCYKRMPVRDMRIH